MDSHEAARIFPVMTGQDYIGLRDNIKEHGLLEPIILYDGKILDGRNRYTACLDLGIDPVYEEYMGEQTPLDYVLSKNLHRRHLNETQRGIIASKIANMPLGTNQYRGSANLPTLPVSQPQAAEMLNVSERTVRSVKAVERYAPELLPKMESGEMSANEAVKIVGHRKKEDRRELVNSDDIKNRDNFLMDFDIQVGQVWQLGIHRLMCGNSYLVSDQVKLFQDDIPNALITDPPYGIGYKPDWSKWSGAPSDYNEIIGDDSEFNPAMFLSYPTVVLFGANYFSNRLSVGGWICWDKRLDEDKDNMFGSPFELAWYRSINTTRKAIMIRVLHGGVVNADSITGNNEKRFHPTQKPLSVMQQILDTLTKEHDLIYDPFSGSGSTLLACERTKRRCLAMEIEPDYVSITLQRWLKRTGIQPVLMEI